MAGLTPTGLFVAGAADGAVFAIDGSSGAVRKLGQAQDRVRGIAIDVADGLILAAGHDGHVRTFGIDDGVAKSDFDVGHGRVYGISATPRGKDVVVDRAFVERRLQPLLHREDLSRFIL